MFVFTYFFEKFAFFLFHSTNFFCFEFLCSLEGERERLRDEEGILVYFGIRLMDSTSCCCNGFRFNSSLKFVTFLSPHFICSF